MYRDERYFDRPNEFMPERFLRHPYGLKDGVVDDPARRPNLQYGGGRRVCPGINAARMSIVCIPDPVPFLCNHHDLQELVTARLIWGFDVLPALDPYTGKDIYPDLDDCTEVRAMSLRRLHSTIDGISFRVFLSFPCLRPPALFHVLHTTKR